MSTPEWIEYTGSDKQIKEMLLAANRHGVMIIHHNGELCPGIFTDSNELAQHLDKRTKYPIKMFLLCQPHPYADLIKIWADTGCPVWVKVTKRNDWVRYIDGVYYKPRAMVHEYLEPTTKPDWNIPGAEYSLTPFED